MSSEHGGDGHRPDLSAIPALEDLPAVGGRRVLVRADLNVPLRPKEGGGFEVADDFRLRSAVPTLQWLVDNGARVTVCSHLGRPKGKVDPRYSMEPVREGVAMLVPGVEVMENLRFDPGEETNDPGFVRQLVDGFDYYVNDAFGSSHRRHASIIGPPALLPSAGGRLLRREFDALSRILVDPARPFLSIVGGAKVADKLGVTRALSQRVDEMLLGGAMAFTFLAALGREMGDSPVEPSLFEEARSLLGSHDRVHLPADLVALGPGGVLGIGRPPAGVVRQCGLDLPDGWRGVDIGAITRERFAASISKAKTVLWNGPMGVFEDSRFAQGTRAIAEAVASCPGFTVVGGGETVGALHEFGLEGRVDHISSGGGATLELIEKGDLPGLAALRESAVRRGR